MRSKAMFVIFLRLTSTSRIGLNRCSTVSKCYVSLMMVASALRLFFLEEEVKIALRSCNDIKSPGPDGFSFSFLQSCWEIVKKDVVHFVMDFYSNSTLSKVVMTSFITLIPKINNPHNFWLTIDQSVWSFVFKRFYLRSSLIV